jgi:hypothetical protein
MDFMGDCPATGRKFRVLTIVDDLTRESPAIEVGTSLPGPLERSADHPIDAIFSIFSLALRP